MLGPTFFGEVTEPTSRAVWYSDEEDDDEEDDQTIATDNKISKSSKIQLLEPYTHEFLRSSTKLDFKLSVPQAELQKLRISTCIVSLTPPKQSKLEDISTPAVLVAICHVEPDPKPLGRAYCYQSTSDPNNQLLWIVVDSSNDHLNNFHVGYVVESFCQKLKLYFNVSDNIVIISQQFSSIDKLGYLTNDKNIVPKVDITGIPLMPPSLIKSHFEAALFEYLTLSIKSCVIVCLPDPRNYWFNKGDQWPSIPKDIIDHRVKGTCDEWEKSLIFT